MQENLLEFSQPGPVVSNYSVKHQGPRTIESVGFANFKYLPDLNHVEAEVRLFMEGTDHSSPTVVVRTSVPLGATDMPDEIQSNLYLSAAKLFRQLEVESNGSIFSSHEVALAS
jgi:hypothetical protein